MKKDSYKLASICQDCPNANPLKCEFFNCQDVENSEKVLIKNKVDYIKKLVSGGNKWTYYIFMVKKCPQFLKIAV
jgi:hypothetical protein